MAAEWQEVLIEDCMAAIIDYRGKTPRKTTSGIPLITAKIVKGGRIETPEEFIDPKEYDLWMSRGLPQAGDIVMTTEAPLGEVAQLADQKVALAQRLITLRGKPGVLDNTYLKYVMQSAFVQEQLSGRASGTTVLGIKQSELRKVKLPLAPFTEQRAIASLLGALDDKIELNRRMNETLEATARLFFKDWFVDFGPTRAKAEGRPPYLAPELWALFPDALDDDDKPVRWEVSTIGQEVKVVGGSTPSTKELAYWDGDFHWATPKDLSTLKSPVLLETERQITQAGVSQISSGLLPIGTVFLSSRAPIGYLAIAQVETAINQGFIAMICEDRLSNMFIWLWTQANMDAIHQKANGSTFLEISKSNFRPIPVVVADETILKRFDEIVQPLYSQIVANEQEIRSLAQTRDLLLPKLMSGEIRLRDAEKMLEAAV